MGILNGLDHLISHQVFFPDKVVGLAPDFYGLPFEDLWFEAADGVRLHGWLVGGEPGGALFLFCHGNAGNISHRLENISLLHQLGLNVLIFDYRGYGHSSGRINEAGFYLDAEAAHSLALDRAEEMGVKLVIFGRSLGGVAAVYLAAKSPCDGVILESTFTNLGAMAKRFFPVPGLETGLRRRFNSLTRIRRASSPILFFHGDADNLVPYRLGRQLFEAAPEPKEFVTLSGAGHNDTYLVGGPAYFEKISSFIDSLG